MNPETNTIHTPDHIDPSESGQESGYRLTRRGKRLAKSLAVAAGAGILTLGANVVSADDSEKEQPQDTTTVIASTGDTLWNMADEAKGDVGMNRGEVMDFAEANSPDLEDGLHAGDEVVLPAESTESE